MANRPLIAFPLQHLVSAGIKHALVLAPANQHRAIETALKSVRLQVPNTSAGANAKGDAASTSTVKYLPCVSASDNAPSNIVVSDGLAGTTSAAASDASNVAMRVQLLPLGPYDSIGNSPAAIVPQGGSADRGDSDDDDDGRDGRSDDDGDPDADELAFRPIARPGTAELIRWLDSIGKLDADPLVLPVDLIAPSIPLSSFLLSYLSSKTPSTPTVTSLLYERGAGETLGRDREKEGPPRLVAAYSSGRSHSDAAQSLLSSHDLLFLSEPPTATSSSSSLDVRLSLLQHHPRARISTNLIDSHVYILRRDQVIPLLKARRDLTSLREHVLPLVAKTSWQSGLLDKSGWRERIRRDREEKRRINARGGSGDVGDDDLESAGADAVTSGSDLMRLAFERSSLGTPRGVNDDVDDRYTIRAVAVVARLEVPATTLVPQLEGSGGNASGGSGAGGDKNAKGSSKPDNSAAPDDERFFARANTLPTYLECNRFMLRVLAASGAAGGSALYFPLPSLVSSGESSAATTDASSSSSSISTSAQLSPDTLYPLASPLTISDRVSLKRCVISPHARIARSCRISGSILMEGCVIGEGCKLENCIVGPGARIGDKATLRDVDIGPGAVVKRGIEVRGEKIGRDEGGGDGVDSGDESGEGGSGDDDSD